MSASSNSNSSVRIALLGHRPLPHLIHGHFISTAHALRRRRLFPVGHLTEHLTDQTQGIDLVIVLAGREVHWLAYMKVLTAFISAAISRRRAIASTVYRPCLSAFRLPFGAPGDGPPCIRQRPFFIAGDWHGVPRRVRARHRRTRCIGKLLCMRLILCFPYCPPPGVSTIPTTACPPACTCTCSTVTFC